VTPAGSTVEQSRRVFLTAEWRYLVMLNYSVSRELLDPLVPAGTSLDLWGGNALMSVVGFRFLRTRVFGVPVPLHRDFDEVNVRFYVRRCMPDGEIRRGVVFIRELVPRAAIAVVARLLYNEPYRTLPMNSLAPASPIDAPGRIAYGWRTGKTSQEVSAAAIGTPRPPAPDSEAEFVTGHYWGYTRQRDGGTAEYEVRHAPWRVWDAAEPTLTINRPSVFGPELDSVLAQRPRSALIAEGSPVTVFYPRRTQGVGAATSDR
jgi:uncharacterized protein YqjF (DUF2071 family)